MRIGIILDNPRRELDGVLIVAHQLLRRHHDVFVIPMYQQGYDLPWLNLDAVIVNYARPNNREFLMSCRALGVGVVVLDNEGSVVPKDDAKTPYGPQAIRATGLADYIDQYLFWGQRQYDFFLQRSPIPAERLHVTGCPRYDFCHPQWQPTLDYPWRDYVLVNMNFSAVNPLFTGTVEKELQQFVKVGWDLNETRVHLNESLALLERYIQALHALAKANSDRGFLVRPHPFENPDLYRRRFADRPNVRVDGSGTVFAMIRHATCALHLNCQTAIETLLMGKLPVSLEFLNVDTLRERYPLPSAISFPARSFDELNAIVNAPERYWPMVPAQASYEWEIRPLFHHNDGKAAVRVAEVAERAGRQSNGRARRWRHSTSGGFTRPSSAQLAQGVMCNLIGSKSVESLRTRLDPRRTTKRVHVDETRDRLKAIAAADPPVLTTRVSHATHPITRFPLATLELRPSFADRT